MNTLPRFEAIDHLHVNVHDRAAAAAWYGQALGLQTVAPYAHWADAPTGPLVLSDPTGVLHLALFARGGTGRLATVALRVDAAGFAGWHQHLRATLVQELKISDHAESLSFYFSDPDGNSFEITCYEPAARALIRTTPAAASEFAATG